jgi:hypothetical protein
MPAVPMIVMGAVTAGTQIAGTIAGVNANRRAADAAEAQGEFNAGVLERQAEQGERVMGYRLGQFDEQSGQFLGSQQAAINASGVDMSGSAGRARQHSIQKLSQDRSNMHEGFRSQIDEYRNRAQFALENGATQAEIANLNAWSTGLHGTANVMNTGMNFVNSGIDNDWWGLG